MEFRQKKQANKHTFTLHDYYFNFAYEDKSGSVISKEESEQKIAQAELLKKDNFELLGEKLN